MTHQEIVAFLKKRYRLGPWWQQGVTHGYELAIGRRIDGQDLKGAYMMTATKSLAFDVAVVWKALLSKKGQDAWLKPLSPVRLKAAAQFETRDGFFGEVRTLKPARRLRLTWQDPNWEKKTVVEVLLVPRPRGKSLLAFSHLEIQQLKQKAQLRARWQQSIAEFCEVLCSS